MKAISLWEPWASLMAVEAKRNETRGRRTNIRGDVVICAARLRRIPPERAAAWLWSYRRMFSPGAHLNIRTLFDTLNFGHPLCVVDLYDCVPTESLKPNLLQNITLMESELGDYSPGRYAWLTRNCRRFANPFPVRGRQGFFDIPDEQVRAALKS